MKSLMDIQSSTFWDFEFVEKCAESCDYVTFLPSISSNKIFGENQTVIYIYYSTVNTIVKEEVLVHDKISMIASIGGSLGLFLGFSFLSVGLFLLQKLQEKI